LPPTGNEKSEKICRAGIVQHEGNVPGAEQNDEREEYDEQSGLRRAWICREIKEKRNPDG